MTTAVTIYKVSNFMAAYGRGRSLTRDTMDRQLRLVYLYVKVSAITCHARFSQCH